MYLVKSLRTFFGTNAERVATALNLFLPGDEFHETDTSDIYKHNGMAWIKTSAIPDVDDLTTATGSSGEMVRVAATGGLEYRTTTQVLSDIGAAASGHSHSAAGSDGQLLYNNGGAFGGSGAYWDDVNNRLGINTAKPERTMHIVGELIRIDRDGNAPGLITRRTTTGLGAASDISTINSEALSSASTVRTYGAFGVRISDNTDGAEFAIYRYRALVNGTLTDVMSVGTNVGIGTLSPTEKLHVAGNVAPTNNDTWDVGTATFRWDDIYATNGTIQTSDANNKRAIEPSDLGLDFILSLEPVKYKFKKGKRDHYGLTGQQLETALNGRDFAGLTIAEGVYGIRYTELIGPMIQAIHDLSEKVEQLRGRV